MQLGAKYANWVSIYASPRMGKLCASSLIRGEFVHENPGRLIGLVPYARCILLATHHFATILLFAGALAGFSTQID